MSQTITVTWGTTPSKKNFQKSEKIYSDFITESQKEKLIAIMNNSYPSPITGYTIIRGAFHGAFTRIVPNTINWGKAYSEEYNQLLDDIANALGWYHAKIDGANAVVKQNPEGNSTWERWKKNNPASHLKEASKKNWEVYHSHIDDLDELGEWQDELFDSSKWEGQGLSKKKKIRVISLVEKILFAKHHPTAVWAFYNLTEVEQEYFKFVSQNGYLYEGCPEEKYIGNIMDKGLEGDTYSLYFADNIDDFVEFFDNPEIFNFYNNLILD